MRTALAALAGFAAGVFIAATSRQLGHALAAAQAQLEAAAAADRADLEAEATASAQLRAMGVKVGQAP